VTIRRPYPQWLSQKHQTMQTCISHATNPAQKLRTEKTVFQSRGKHLSTAFMHRKCGQVAPLIRWLQPQHATFLMPAEMAQNLHPGAVIAGAFIIVASVEA